MYRGKTIFMGNRRIVIEKSGDLWWAKIYHLDKEIDKQVFSDVKSAESWGKFRAEHDIKSKN